MSILDIESGEPLFSARAMGSIWVELAARVQAASIKAAYPQPLESDKIAVQSEQQPNCTSAALQHTWLGGPNPPPTKADMRADLDAVAGAAPGDVSTLEGRVQGDKQPMMDILKLETPKPGQKA